MIIKPEFISCFLQILPILIGSIRFWHLAHIRSFILFIAYGLFTDTIIMFYVEFNASFVTKELAISMHNIYTLVESVFFIWFIKTTLNNPRHNRIFTISLWSMVPMWAIGHLLVKNSWTEGSSMSAFYLSYSNMVISILGAHALLKMSERKTVSPVHWWLIIGIFFYNFCSLLFSLLTDAPFISELWNMQLLINILSQLTFAFAFTKKVTVQTLNAE